MRHLFVALQIAHLSMRLTPYAYDKTTGEENHIEVKTTSGPFTTPFFMSAAEVKYARTCAHRYEIYRLYAYSSQAQEINFFVINKPGRIQIIDKY
jgi:hypothetical protein